jgi:hypothetical protein
MMRIIAAGDASGDRRRGHALFLTVYQWMNDCLRSVFFLMVEFESQTGSAGGGVGSAPSGAADRGRRKYHAKQSWVIKEALPFKGACAGDAGAATGQPSALQAPELRVCRGDGGNRTGHFAVNTAAKPETRPSCIAIASILHAGSSTESARIGSVGRSTTTRLPGGS